MIPASERRTIILKMLCRRRHDTIENLALETGVSKRTVRRDIEALSLYEPIYTVQGRYGGGVYVADTFTYDRMYMKESEIAVLKKLSENGRKCGLSDNETKILATVISEYTKPSAERRRI